MILDLRAFVAEEKAFWSELDSLLLRLEKDLGAKLTVRELERFHYLFTRAAAGLSRIQPFSSEPETKAYLEGLVGRAHAYSALSQGLSGKVRFNAWRLFAVEFPRAFRRHAGAFWLATGALLLGTLISAIAVSVSPEAKEHFLPGFLQMDPAERVEWEESGRDGDEGGGKTQFSAFLMTHNIQVALFAFALGALWALPTLLLVFYNGLMLGAVCADYLMAGQGVFLTGWLLPHGAIEIPAILVGGMAGLLLGRTMISGDQGLSLAERLKANSRDMLLLAWGFTCMLIWAGLVEAFLSQYHEPVLPYAAKIGFGIAELIALVWFLSRAGLEGEKKAEAPHA